MLTHTCVHIKTHTHTHRYTLVLHLLRAQLLWIAQWSHYLANVWEMAIARQQNRLWVLIKRRKLFTDTMRAFALHVRYAGSRLYVVGIYLLFVYRPQSGIASDISYQFRYACGFIDLKIWYLNLRRAYTMGPDEFPADKSLDTHNQPQAYMVHMYSHSEADWYELIRTTR